MNDYVDKQADYKKLVDQLAEEQAKLSVAAGKEALDLAQKTLAAEQRKYELGSGTIFFVLEAQTELASAQQSLLQSQMALARVDHATGELLEPYHPSRGPFSGVAVQTHGVAAST